MDDVARLALALPATTEGERRHNRTWFVNGKGFAWDRPFSRFATRSPTPGWRARQRI